MKKYLKWILVILALFFVFAVYRSETKRLKELRMTEKRDTYRDSTTIINNQVPKNTSTSVPKRPSKVEKRIYVMEITGDTLDLSKDKFIMILADKFRDKNIACSFSIWFDMSTCAWSSGILKIFVYDRNLKLLKTTTTKIDKQLGESCMQLEDLNLFMGDLIQRAAFINAEFTDDRGQKYYQMRKKLDDDMVDVKPSTNNLTNEERVALKKLKQNIRILFNELITFKGKEDFRVYGFATGYKYNKWLLKVKSLKNNPTNQLLLITDGFVAGDLESLGLWYVSSEGQETEYTKLKKEQIQYGLE